MFKSAVCACTQASARSRCDDDMRTVSAGEACYSSVCGEFSLRTAKLAQLSMEDQEYTQGFCPCEALEMGTLFPELLS